MKDELKNKYFSCIYCLYPKIIYNPTISPTDISTKCFLTHQKEYNIEDYISFKKEQMNILSKLKCDKCESHKNITFCSNEKTFLCGKCFPKNHQDKTHTLYDLNKIDNCPKHKKDFLYCKKCELPFCKLCDKETHSKHEFCNIKEFFLSEKEEQKAQFIIIKHNQINNDLLCKIFNTIINDKLDYSNTIYKYRQSEISLYTLMKNEYNINKSKNYNLLLNIRNYILKKFESINNLSYIEFIKETKVPEEKIQVKDSLIQYLLGKKYINFDNIPYNDDNNFFILKDKLNDIYIDHFLLLKNDIFITSGPNCYIYDESMEVKLKFTVGDKNNQKNIIISYIHYKKYNEIENREIIYAFITGIIYELILLKDGKDNYSYEIIEHRNKRISHKVDGVIDMKNGDVIVCSHMYPVICWRKDENKKFFEYKVLTEQKPYIKNAINIIHLSDDEFVTTSNSWPSLKFYLYQGYSDKTKEEYKIIKDIKLHCSKRKNTLALWNKEIIIVGLEYNLICLVSVKYKEIVTTIKGIDALYIFVRNNNDIIINEIMENYFLATAMKIYRFEKGEIMFKGILKNKLQIKSKQIMENNKGNLFISEYGEGKFSLIYVDKS